MDCFAALAKTNGGTGARQNGLLQNFDPFKP
jgi:hypothetical protein